MDFVLRTYPRHLSENVERDVEIEVVFMVDLNRQLLNEELIVLLNLTEQRSVPIRYEYRNRVLKIKPIESLDPLTHYQLQLIGGEKGIRDITGRYLVESYKVEFFTKDVDSIKPPVFLSPTHLSEVNLKPTFSWEPVANAYAYELQISKSNTFHNLVWPSENILVFGTQVTPNINYEQGRYYARIRSVGEDGTRSAYSDVLQFYFNQEITQQSQTNTESQTNSTYSFQIKANSQIKKEDQLTTLQQHFAKQNISLEPKLYVTSSKPSHQTLNIPLSQLNQIVIEFNEDIDRNSVTNLTCYLIEERN
jgi:Bacterial Ig-like domain